jgi:hypothetical protein
MATQIQYPETVACYFACTAIDTGALTQPSTSMKCTIYDPTGAVVANAQDMTYVTSITIGITSYNYVYYYQANTSANLGIYRVRYTATNASYVTITDDSFVLSSTGV